MVWAVQENWAEKPDVSGATICHNGRCSHPESQAGRSARLDDLRHRQEVWRKMEAIGSGGMQAQLLTRLTRMRFVIVTIKDFLQICSEWKNIK